MFTVYQLKNTDLLTGGDKVELAVIAGNKRALRTWVQYGGVIPGHIGELRRLPDRKGYIYYTTIGATYLFERT